MENSKVRVISEYESLRGTTAAQAVRNINAAPGEPGRHCPKLELHQKIIITAWWTTQGVVHYSLLPPTTNINANYYCRGRERMKEKLAEKQPKLVNRDGIVLLQDDANPHSAKMTSTKIKELDIEPFDHPP
ncbi:hypothetical protein RvY_14081 [Ramazzottius varieornatus]|uniref:Tc1-like transposase DDE domain-containing protein n=1 Tax=Ramazzottius varieornatus TaxID=947166 RepID=A0A1D1VRU0_RAMVA|nr:hypothetical protein RvY_14081 [Ramazzottius varieornatus]